MLDLGLHHGFVISQAAARCDVVFNEKELIPCEISITGPSETSLS